MRRNNTLLLLISAILLVVMGFSSITQAIAGSPASTTTAAAVTSAATSTLVEAATEADDEKVTRPAGWSDDTHSNEVEPNYEVVFPQDKVNQLTITITPDEWATLQANMTELLGEPGQSGPSGGDRPEPPDDFAGERPEPPDGFTAPENGEPPASGGPNDGGGGSMVSENPTWVTATVEFEGNTWTNVGFRYKGNSSLVNSWNSNTLKLPFKLDFDEFEDEYTEIENQRFYGFKQLSFSNDFGDSSHMRDTITYDLLDEAGLPAAETAYYEVILDYGEGQVSLGLYTAVEVIDDTVIERYFGDDSGNIYEGDGQAVSLAEGTFDQIENSFQKENNKTEADWSDIEELYDVLHSEERITDPATWRANLESVFDVDSFLEWLAISAALQHWDTYGSMTHNFYLYHNPDTDQLTWISWDHNMVLGGMDGQRQEADTTGVAQDETAAANEPVAGNGPGGHSVSLDKVDVDDNWPLIRYLLDDPTYYERYLDYLEEAGNLLSSEALATKYQTLAELIRPYVDNPDTFDNAVQSLAERTTEQAQAVTDFLANQ